MKNELPKALKTKTLPQYMKSEDVMARFLVAAHGASYTEIAKTEYAKGPRSVREGEVQRDALDHFLVYQTDNRDEFVEELEALIGRDRASTFCRLIAEAWYDDNKRRCGPEMLPIRASVHAYLKDVYGIPPNEAIDEAMLTSKEVAQVLQLTWRLLETSVQDWVKKIDRDLFTSSGVFLRRGLVLDTLFEDDHAYTEPSVLSSWSLSVTLAEQFANTNRPGQKSARIHADLYLMEHRVLFFSPFIPNMDVNQLEACIIPAGKTQRLHFQGEHRDVGEYLLDDPKELR